MEIEISRSMSPEMEKAVQAVKELAEAGEMDLSSVITAYDIIYFILFMIFAIWFISAIVKSVKAEINANKKVKRADDVLNVIASLKDDGHDNISLEEFSDALSANSRPPTRARKVGSTQNFNKLQKDILKSLTLQRRNNS